MEKRKIFLVDDKKGFSDLIARSTQAKDFDLTTFQNPYEAIEALDGDAVDLIISGMNMPSMNGLDLFHRIRDVAPAVPVILIAALDITDQNFKQGCADPFLARPEEEKLPPFWNLVHEELTKQDIKRRRSASKSSDTGGEGKIGQHLIGCSDAIQKVRQSIELVADLPATVLISGETGTGKELVAQLIHLHSGLAEDAFFAVNCGAFSSGVLESELFGHERGAFTGAIGQRTGFFEMADQGSLFLDEIGDAPKALQTKLLRVIESKKFTRVGSSKVIQSNFRLITATNQDLAQAVSRGRFRSDLLYRIRVYEINIPPLRRRKEDIPLLSDFFLARFNQDYGRSIEGFSEAAIIALREYDWPGNVRELINVIEQAVILCRDDRITTDHLPFAPEVREKAISSLDLTEMERLFMALALKRTAGNKSKACRLLGVSRKTLIEKVKKYGLEGS